MSAADAVAAAILGALLLYVLLGGADFGGGVWDLLASGPRKRAQRALIEDVIGPVWEVNHIWLILAVVLLFTGFPLGFAVVATALHVPITALLVGIVLRGTAFAFRQYDDRRDEVQRRWGRVFAMASVITPVCLGVCLGAITEGEIRVGANGVPTTGFFAPWIGLFPLACGVFTLALFAFIAAVFLTNETDDPALRDDFRVRALGAGVALGVAAAVAGLGAHAGAEAFAARLFGSSWSLLHQAATGLAALTTLGALVARRFALARAAAVVQVVLIIAGWGLAQHPYLVAPDVTFVRAAAPAATQRAVLIALGLGALLLVPALIWLLSVFRWRRRHGPPGAHDAHDTHDAHG